MARKAGKNLALYMAITSGGTASPVPYIANFELPRSTDKFEVTAGGDTNKTYVVGLPDSQGSYAGFWDSATAQMYTAAGDGVARKFYFYPDSTDTTRYFFGTAFFDITITFPVDGAIAIAGSWSAASDVISV